MESEMQVVYVYPDEENYVRPVAWKSDDYEVRETMLCTKCDTMLHVHYSQPLASCDCGTQEWRY